VNQNQTFQQEQKGGYLWSPKRNANGARNPFYEAMREVSPGDVVFRHASRPSEKLGLGDLVADRRHHGSNDGSPYASALLPT
jgi:hypothetical protein